MERIEKRAVIAAQVYEIELIAGNRGSLNGNV